MMTPARRGDVDRERARRRGLRHAAAAGVRVAGRALRRACRENAARKDRTHVGTTGMCHRRRTRFVRQGAGFQCATVLSFGAIRLASTLSWWFAWCVKRREEGGGGEEEEEGGGEGRRQRRREGKEKKRKRKRKRKRKPLSPTKSCVLWRCR